MKNLLKIVILFSLISLLNCKQRETDNIYYLHITNNTMFPTELSFYRTSDSSFLKTYKVAPYESSYFDTTIYKAIINGGDYYNLVKGEHVFEESSVPYPATMWGSYTSVKYTFGDFKESVLQKSTVEYCNDTLSTITLCNYKELELITYGETPSKDAGNINYMKYYITNQQYLLADSL